MAGSVGERAALRGRDAEWRRVAAAVRAVAGGRGGTLLLSGEAGIGKSALLFEAMELARSLGVEVRHGAGDELERSRPLGVVGLALQLPERLRNRHLGSEAEDPGSWSHGFAAREAVLDAVDDLVSAGPALLAVDDLQWADGPSVAALAALCRRAAQLPLLIAVAHRPLPADLEPLVEVATGCGAVSLALGPLDESAVEQLSIDVTGALPGPTLRAMLGGTRGNPFFVVELLRTLVDERRLERTATSVEYPVAALPPTLRQTILRRVRSLSAAAVELLRCGAVLGGTFDLDEVAAMLERSAVSLHGIVLDAVDANLIEEAGPRLRIRHDLIREAIYGEMPVAIRRSLHRQAAAVLERSGEPASVVAAHLLHAGADRSALDTLRAAAGELLGSDPVAAAAVLDHAADAKGLGDGARLQLAVERVEALAAAGRLREAEGIARSALNGAPATSGPDLTARLRLGLAKTLLLQGDAGAAVRELRAARDLGELGEGRRAALLADIAWAKLASFDLSGAQRDAAGAESLARAHDEPRVLASALAVRSRLAAYGARFDAAIELGEAAVRAAGRDPASVWRTPQLYLGLGLLNAGRAGDARRVLHDGRRRAEAAGVVPAIASYHHALVMCGFHADGWDDALAEGQAARSLRADAGTRAATIQTESMMGLLWLHRGQLDLARDALARAEADFAVPGYDVGGIIWLLWLRAAFAELAGDVAEASRLLWSAVDLAIGLQVDSVKLWFGPETTRLALAAGERGRAESVAAAVSAVAEHASSDIARGAAAWCAGLVAADPDLLTAAADAYRNTSRRLDLGLATEAAAEVYQRRGARDDAVARFRDACAVYDELSAARDARRVRAALRALGVRPGSRHGRRRPATGPASLTPTEAKVLDLIGQGLRNAAIAEELFVSRRTVETHVGHLYTKLGVDTRVALANHAVRLGRARQRS